MKYLQLVRQHWLVLLIATVISGVVVTGLSFLPDQLYRSEVQLLIVQEQQETADSYTSQKAAEKLGNNLVNVIETFNFLDKVIATGYLTEEEFSVDAKDRKDQWEEKVDARMIPETGILIIEGYSTNPGKAEDIALGVAQVFTTSASDYHGGGESVDITLIDGPITSTKPVKPNIPLNGVAAAALGLMVAYSFFLLRMESKEIVSDRQQIQYESLPGSGPVFPLESPKYKVLDEYPNEEMNFGAVTEDPGDSDVISMNNHIKGDE